jgi:hypothetical protein
VRTKVHVCNKLRESVHLVQKGRLSPKDRLAHNSTRGFPRYNTCEIDYILYRISPAFEMMTWSEELKTARWCFIGLICIGVVLQMLGTPITLWDLHGSDDHFISVLLMGFCVLSCSQHFSPLYSSLSVIHISAPRYSFLSEHILFHPPLPAIST